MSKTMEELKKENELLKAAVIDLVERVKDIPVSKMINWWGKTMELIKDIENGIGIFLR